MPAATSAELSDRQRLCCLLAATEREADALLSGRRADIDTVTFERRTGLDNSRVQEILGSAASLRSSRIDVNAATALQLHQVPTMTPAAVRSILQGGPFYSLTEFEAASRLDTALVKDLFAAPQLGFKDKVTGRDRSFTPVPGKYFTTIRSDLESGLSFAEFGFVESVPDQNASMRILRRDPNANNDRTHLLKQSLGGQVFPVLWDQDNAEHYYVPANIDIWFHRDTSHESAVQIIHEQGMRVRHSRPGIGFYQVDLGTYSEKSSVLAESFSRIHVLQSINSVRFAELTEVGLPDFEPLSELPMADYESASAGNRLWHNELIELEAAHAITQGSANTTVLIIDSGINPEHQDLSQALRPDWQTLDLNFDLMAAVDEHSPRELAMAHGTKVASLVCGSGSGGGSRVRGVAPDCWLLPVKISGSPLGQSYGFRAVAIQEAIDYVAPGSRGVINLSWSTQGEHLGIREALFDASDRGFAIVCSAGNFGSHESQIANRSHYPSLYAYQPGGTEQAVIDRRKIRGLASVGAVNASQRKASYSYFGSDSVTFVAPGGEPGQAGVGMFVASTPDNYAYDAGTSFAAPLVTGLVALVLSANSALSAQAVIDLIRSSATDIDQLNPSYAGQLGTGLINARRALEMATQHLVGSVLVNGQPVTNSQNTNAETPINNVGTTNSGLSGALDINRATWEELATLPLMGDWSSKIVIAYRDSHGRYNTIWDLQQSGGIDTWAIRQLAPLIYAGAVGPDPELIAPSLALSASAYRSSLENSLGINSASVRELMGLPMIGPWTAQALVKCREDNGRFTNIDDLLQSGALDQWMIQRLLPLILFD